MGELFPHTLEQVFGHPMSPGFKVGDSGAADAQTVSDAPLAQAFLGP